MFSHIFGFMEDGFRNELLVQMYSRSFYPGQDVVWMGQRFQKISFLINGRIDCITEDGLTFFKLLPGAVFGDYQVIYGLRSNFFFRTHGQREDEKRRKLNGKKVNVMVVESSLWDHLMELYPNTASALKELGFLKREIFLHYMEKNIELSESKSNTGVPISLAHNSV